MTGARSCFVAWTFVFCMGTQAADGGGDRRPAPASPSATALAQLIGLAERHSPAMAAARNALEIAEFEKENSFYRFFPALDLEAKHGLLQTAPELRSSPWHSEMNLILTEHLYDPDNNATPTKYRLMDRRLERVRLESIYQRDETALKIVQAYLDWSASLQQREIDENKSDLLRRQYNVLEVQYKQGIKTKRDVLRIETEIKKLEMDVLRRDSEVALSFQKLATVVGVSPQVLEAEKIEGEEANTRRRAVGAEPKELSLEDHVKSRIAALKAQEADFESQIVERNYWPRLSLQGEVKYNNHDYMGTGNRWSQADGWSYGLFLVLRYNLWDFGIRRRDVQIARIRERNVADDNRKVLLDLGSELREVFLRLREFRANLANSRELLILEQQSYTILNTEYRNGRASYLDLITNLNSLIDARSKFMASYFGLMKQQMVYAFHRGELYEVIQKK
ncbi:MAG: TolC family protein [Bdellovibrionales bacterium]